jgi:hypothetical protein
MATEAVEDRRHHEGLTVEGRYAGSRRCGGPRDGYQIRFVADGVELWRVLFPFFQGHKNGGSGKLLKEVRVGVFASEQAAEREAKRLCPEE